MGNDNQANIKESPWYIAANYSLVAVTTSAAVLAVQNPLKSMMLNQLQYGSIFGVSAKAGRLAMIKSFYTGIRAQMAGASARSAYVSGSKKSVGQESASENIIEESGESVESKPKRNAWSNVGQVMALSLGEVMITQVSESLSQLQKANIVQAGFKWQTPHNVMKLFSNGFAVRLASGFVNFSALCILEDSIARALPIENKPLKHTVAGSMSGMVAAIFSYPFSYYKDYTLARTKVIDGRLKNFSVFEAKAELQRQVSERGVGLMAKDSLATLKVQLPLRMMQTAAIFAMVSLVEAALGKDPIQTVSDQWALTPVHKKGMGFFSKGVTSQEEKSKGSEIAPPDFF